MNEPATLTVHHIPACPFSQRLEILLHLKGRRDAVRFDVVDITKPRDARLLEKTRGSTALPVLETGHEQVLKESLVILQYLDELWPDAPVAQRDPYRRAVENMLTRMEGDFATQGYVYVMNQRVERRDELRAAMLRQYARLDDFLVQHAPRGPFLFDEFGWAETVFTPFFVRFAFLEYYEDFDLADEPRQGRPADGQPPTQPLGEPRAPASSGARYRRVRAWIDACLRHPAAQQISREEVIKLYYDYAKGAGNGALLPGRARSSFAFEPHWRDRPWPPKQKYERSATDTELGLSASIAT